MVAAIAVTSSAKALVLVQKLPPKEIVIEGIVKGNTKGKNRVYITDLNDYRDSAVADNGRFNIKIPFSQEKTFFINFEFEMGYRPYAIVCDQPGAMLLSFDLESGVLHIAGLETPSIYHAFMSRQEGISRDINRVLTKVFGTAYLPPTDSGYHLFLVEKDKLSAENKLTLLKWQLQQHPNAYASAYILVEQTASYPLPVKEMLYSMLGTAGKQTSKGKELHALIQGTKNAAIGNSVSDFTLVDSSGKSISLRNFRGKYVLLDFWASWCGPCRASFPRMRQLYETFHADGLEIFSISIDLDHAKWLQALNEEALPWIQVINDGIVAKKNFAVTAIPTLFLISPDGKILMRELGAHPNGGGQIEQKLEAVYNKRIPVSH